MKNTSISILNACAHASTGTSKTVLKEWVNCAQPIKCTPFDDLPMEIQYLIEDMQEMHPVKKNLCHDSAFHWAMKDERFKVQTGWACSGLPIEHSWVSIEHQGKEYHFDPTDWHFFSGTHFSDYLSISSFNKKELLLHAYQTQTTGPFHIKQTLERLDLDTKPNDLNVSPIPQLNLSARKVKGSMMEVPVIPSQKLKSSN